LAKYLELLGSVGLSTALSGGAPLADVLQKTKFPRLTVLAAGPIPPNPSELLGSMAAKKLLSDLRAQFDYVINFVIRKLNSGAQWYKEFLELHHYLLEKGILLNNGKLPEWDFKNIVTVALRAGETNWVEKFINDYKNSLPEEVKENAYSYNMAAYFHSVGRFEETMQLLQEIDFTDESYQVGSKIILLKSYFELGAYDAAMSLITAFRRLIERSKTMSAYRKQSNLNMLIALKKIFKLQIEFDYSNKTALKKYIKSIESSIQKLQPLENADWIAEKLKSIKIDLG
jgi:hypothetical protein